MFKGFRYFILYFTCHLPDGYSYSTLYLLEMEESVCLVADLPHWTVNPGRRGPQPLFCLPALELAVNVKLSVCIWAKALPQHVPTVGPR